MSVDAAAVGPRARSSVIVRPLGDETLVYDGTSHRAHCLNRSASLVFERCDGATPREALVRALTSEREGVPEAEAAELVSLALDRLADAGLLEDSPPAPDTLPDGPPSRRAALRTFGSASLLPLVVSIVAPTPADAATCVPRNGNCNSSSECCPDAPCCRQRGPRPPQCSPGGGSCILP